MATVSLSGVGKVYPDGTRAVRDLDLEIADGELLVLVGPSGCGKTTTLRMTAGLEEITEGEIRIGGRVVNDLDPRRRDVAMVFQNYALYPHMTVFDNLAFPLLARRLPREEIRGRVEKAASMLALSELLRRKPRALSGGQRQRVAIGRALVREPQLFLMDEPLSNLDARLRTHMRGEIAALQRELGVTTMYVTHDQVEAMTMGTRIALMRRGEIQQHGPPQELFDRPANLFVAAFIGSPTMNLLRGQIERERASLICVVGGQRVALPDGVAPLLDAYAGNEVAVGIRPEHLGAATATSDGALRFRGRIRYSELLGAERLVQIETDALPLTGDALLDADGTAGGSEGPTLGARTRTDLALVTARLDAHVPVLPGELIEVMAPVTDLYFFDLGSGRAIH
jgi:multiple sugar transport system ATP-binding protein